MTEKELKAKLAEEEEELQRQMETIQQKQNRLKERQAKLNSKQRKADTHMKCELAGILLSTVFGEGFDKYLDEEQRDAFYRAITKKHTSNTGETYTIADTLLKETKKEIEAEQAKAEEVTIDMPQPKPAEQTSFDSSQNSNGWYKGY